MSNFKIDFINYRKLKAHEALSDALLLSSEERWNATVNRLYYACFYILSAVLLGKNLDAKTHVGVKNQFNLHFVKTGLVSIDDGRLYADLFDSRQKGDYGDLFDFDREAVEALIEPVRQFIKRLEGLL